MVDKIPLTFLKAGDPVIATYDWVDLSSGTGYITYYLGRTTNLNILTNNVYYSNPSDSSVDLVAGDPLKEFQDIDFDVKFELPQTVRGTAILNIPHGVHIINNGEIAYSFIYAYARKWDGTTETELVSTSGAAVIGVGTGAGAYTLGMDAIDLEIPSTHFKVGETLRITIKQWGYEDGAGTKKIFFGNDPKNRATTSNASWGTNPSQCTFQVPFKLEV